MTLDKSRESGRVSVDDHSPDRVEDAITIQKTYNHVFAAAEWNVCYMTCFNKILTLINIAFSCELIN